jgi:carbonic anhydrase
MDDLNVLLENNKTWAAEMTQSDPLFFQRLSSQQVPKYLWISCADSRVPATQLVGLLPGEMFVHRNVANVVVHTDLNCLSVIQYAVDVLKVKHIIVCGHYGCGGVQTAFQNRAYGLIDNWLRHVQDVMQLHSATLNALERETDKINRLCELNVLEQVIHVGQTTILQQAWGAKQEVIIHGVIYSLADGRLRDLGIHIASQDEVRAYL